MPFDKTLYAALDRGNMDGSWDSKSSLQKKKGRIRSQSLSNSTLSFPVLSTGILRASQRSFTSHKERKSQRIQSGNSKKQSKAGKKAIVREK